MGNGSFIPNSTQVHNVVLDVLLPFMREGERAVFLYIYRRTFGFNRHEDSIGLDQFEGGLVTREGKRLDYGCGMKRRVIIQALGFLTAAGIIERLEGGMGRTHISRYRMNVKECPIVQQLEQMQEGNATPEEISQILHPFRKVADSARITKKKPSKSNSYNDNINGAEYAPIVNDAESAPNTAIKGAENDTERVQKRNPQSIRENQTTEKEDTPPTPSDVQTKKKGRQKVPEHPLPDDWHPSEKNRQGIITKYPGANVDRLVDAMESWAHSKGVMKCDWEATLRTFAARDWKDRGCPEVQTSHGRAPISHDEVEL